MKIRTTVEALNQAFEVAGIVKPKLRESGESAFLVANHSGRVFVHSYDGQRYVRTELKIETLEGEGAFAFPHDKVKSLNFVEGWIDIESGQDDKRHWVKYTTEGGAKVDLSTYDHNNFNTLVRKLDDAKEERLFSSALLLNAFRSVVGYAPPAIDKEHDHYNTIQLFDQSKPEWANGDGVMFAADGTRAAYLSCSALKGRGLGVRTEHLSHLTSFLSKFGPKIKVKFGEDCNFLVEVTPNEDGTYTEGSVIGWANTAKNHSHYKYYGTNEDGAVLMVPRALIVKSLKHMRSVLASEQAKVRLTVKDDILRLESASGGDSLSSAPVGVMFLNRDDQSPSTQEFGFNVNVDHILDLFEPVRGHEVEFRVAFVAATAASKARKEGAYFRTIEKYYLDDAGEVTITPEGAYECQVTRFTPSMKG
jgi:hypothetical protein